jgi:hypothetical protein
MEFQWMLVFMTREEISSNTADWSGRTNRQEKAVHGTLPEQ